MNALIWVMRNSFSCNTQQIISFSFQSYSLLVMAFHRYFFPNGSGFFTTMEDSFCCIFIIFTVCFFLSSRCYLSAVICLTPWYGMLISCSGTRVMCKNRKIFFYIASLVWFLVQEYLQFTVNSQTMAH